MANWVKLDENKRFVTFESNTVHKDQEGNIEPGWYEISDELVPKVLKFMFNSEFVFDENGNIIDVLGEEWIPPNESQLRAPSIEERISAIELALLELAGI